MLPSAAVRILRVCLLLLVAVLLPVRGVLAAAMICPHASAGAATHAAHVHPAPAHDHEHDHGQAAGPPAHEHDHGQAAGHAAHEHAAAHACTLCASCCFTVPLGPTFSPTVASLEPVAAPLPPVPAPAASFFSDGPERPPRSA